MHATNPLADRACVFLTPTPRAKQNRENAESVLWFVAVAGFFFTGKLVAQDARGRARREIAFLRLPSRAKINTLLALPAALSLPSVCQSTHKYMPGQVCCL